MRKESAFIAFLLFVSLPASGQQSSTYQAPETEYGHPDFQGVWSAASLTPLERPPGVPGLIIPNDQVPRFAALIRQRFPDVIDPDITYQNLE